MKDSGFLRLQMQDLFKGLVVAVGGAVFAIIQPLITTGQFHFDWKYIGTIALGAAVSYLGKNFLTNNRGQILAKDVQKP